MTSHYVELNRGFEVYQYDEPLGELAQRSCSSGAASGWEPLTWEKLLEHRLVVVLGEPGSGKSEELKSVHLRTPGSFLVRLERLVDEPLTEVLSDEDLQQFRRWRAGNREALFLLDAVDEAKLERDDDFAKAVDRVGNEIGTALPRARFVISSRISEWRTQTDLEIVQGLTVPEPKKIAKPTTPGSRTVELDDASGSPPAVVVSLLRPLTPSQVQRYAEGRGVADASGFLKALQDRNAFVFAGRPLDVTHLYNYWQEKGELSSLTELTRFMVEKLLSEVLNKEKLDPLSPERVKEGAEYLAAAAILCKNLRFDIPEDGRFVSEARLSVQAVLPQDWKPDERRALINRALFDSPSRGAFSFHHRTHVEYLAAKWIERLMAHNCGFEELKDFLTTNIGNDVTLRSSLAPVAAWLVTEGPEPWRRLLESLILATAPEVHLLYGDPGALSIPYRRRVLAAIVEKYKDRERVHLHVSPDALARLANKDLAGEINSYLLGENVSDDLKSSLLMVVWEGALGNCAETVLALFSNPSTSNDLRAYCVLAMQFAGTAEQKRRLAQVAQEMDGLSNTAIAHIFETLYPKDVTAEEALKILGKVIEVGHYNYELQHRIGSHLERELQGKDAPVFLQGFLAMLRAAPLGDRSGLSTRFHWVMTFVPLCLQRSIANSIDVEPERDVLVDAVLLLDDALRSGNLVTGGVRDYTDSLRSALAGLPHFRRRLFWRRVALAGITSQTNPFPFYKLNPIGGIVPWGTGDIEWMFEDVRHQDTLLQRVIACEALCYVLGSIGRSWVRYVPRLRRAADAPDLTLRFRRFLRDKLIGPLALIWLVRFRHGVLDRLRWQVRLRHAINAWHTGRERLWLWTHVPGMRAGKFPLALARVADSARSSGISRLGVTDWETVRSRWGRYIADNVAEGCTRAWQQYQPVWPHERQDRNSIDRRVIVGLVGLLTLWQRGRLDFDALERRDVERAVRYACSELNGLPEWFANLANARTADVTRALSEPVTAEFAYPASLEHVYEVVAKLAGGSSGTAATNASISKALRAGDPRNSNVLEQVLSALSRGEVSDFATLAALGPVRVLAYDVGQRPWILWMATWLSVDASGALQYLRSALARLATHVADDLMVLLCAELSGGTDGHRRSEVATFLEPESLKIFIPIVHSHVRPAEDIDRVGRGAYTPEPRDNAQDLRSRLWEALRSSESGEADAVLSSFLSDVRLADQRDRILSMLDERRGKLADPVAWAAEDVREFAMHFRHHPRSDYQLYRLVYRLVVNIKFEVEKSMNATNRKQVRFGDLEKDFQGFLARKLEEQSLEWFSVTQESEVDLGQRPDVHVNASRLNTLPIEVKLANLGWTVRTLLERLENQLIGQYLRPANVNYGLYVIGTTQARRWRLESGEYIGFAELVELLKRRAFELVAQQPQSAHGVEVVGIDFSDPRMPLTESTSSD